MSNEQSIRTFTVLAADDEEKALRSLLRKIDQRADLRVAYATTVGEKALLYAKDHPVDIAFIDLDLRTMEGYDIMDALDSQTQVIVSTGDDKAGSMSIDRGAVDFINKPCEPDRFERAVDRAIERKLLLEGQAARGLSDTVQLTEVGTELAFSIRWEDIVYIRACEKVSVVFLRDGRALKCKKSLRLIEQQAPPEFLRIAKSFLLNLREVDHYDLRQGSRKVVIRSTYQGLWSEGDVDLRGELNNALIIGNNWVDRFAKKMGIKP